MLSRTSVVLGGKLKLSIAARNDSPIPVEDMEIQVVQVAQWRARGLPARHERIVSTLTVRGRALESCFSSEELNLPGGRRALAHQVSEAAGEKILSILDAGQGAMFTTMIPENVLESVEAESSRIKLGSVSTHVLVSLAMGAMSSSPGCRHPLRVVSGLTFPDSDIVADPEVVAVAVGDDESSGNYPGVSYARAVIVLDGYGDDEAS